MSQHKIEDFTTGQIKLLKSLIAGSNICLYRNGQIRLRDSGHNPIENLRFDMFEKVKPFIIKKEGLFYFNESCLKDLPYQITR